MADDVAHEMETRRHDAVDGGMHMLANLPAEATYRLRGHICVHGDASAELR